MTDRKRTSSQILTVVGLLGGLALALPAGAAAQTVQVYNCADGSQSGATSASLSLTDPPANTTAGQTVTLQAVLTLTLPESFELAADLSLISQVGLSTTTFGVQIQIGDTVQVVPASIVVGQLQTLGSSDTASAQLTFPAVSIPSTARGDVIVSMPTAAQYPNSVTNTPADVVFNAVLEQESLLGTPSSVNLACSDSSSPAPTAQVIAEIPIQAANATTKATKPTKTPTATHSKAAQGQSTKSTQTARTSPQSKPVGDRATGPTPSASQSAAGAPATGTPAVSSAQGASTAGAPSTVIAASPTSASSASVATTPATTETPAVVTIPPRTVGSGTFIPTWELILMGSVFPIAALWYAWRTNRKLVAARTELKHRRDSSPVHPAGSAPQEAEPASTRETPSFVTRESETRT